LLLRRRSTADAAVYRSITAGCSGGGWSGISRLRAVWVLALMMKEIVIASNKRCRDGFKVRQDGMDANRVRSSEGALDGRYR
jgi:hypothetical protein